MDGLDNFLPAARIFFIFSILFIIGYFLVDRAFNEEDYNGYHRSRKKIAAFILSVLLLLLFAYLNEKIGKIISTPKIDAARVYICFAGYVSGLSVCGFKEWIKWRKKAKEKGSGRNVTKSRSSRSKPDKIRP